MAGVKVTGADGRVIARHTTEGDARRVAVAVHESTGEVVTLEFLDDDRADELVGAVAEETPVEAVEGEAPPKRSRSRKK